MRPVEEIIAHAIGEFDEIEFAQGEGLVSDGVVVSVIEVFLSRGDADFWALEDELIGRADVFVDFANGKTDVVEKFAGIEFAPGGHGKILFAEHSGKAVEGV